MQRPYARLVFRREACDLANSEIQHLCSLTTTTVCIVTFNYVICHFCECDFHPFVQGAHLNCFRQTRGTTLQEEMRPQATPKWTSSVVSSTQTTFETKPPQRAHGDQTSDASSNARSRPCRRITPSNERGCFISGISERNGRQSWRGSLNA
jgi:hypothetical protein